MSIQEITQTVTRWRDEYRRIADDKSHGVDIRPQHVEAKIKADGFDEVLALLKKSSTNGGFW